jgi:hypothetical protein
MTLTEQAQELLNKEEIKKKIEIIAGKLSRIKELENKIIDIKKEIERIEKGEIKIFSVGDIYSTNVYDGSSLRFEVK